MYTAQMNAEPDTREEMFASPDKYTKCTNYPWLQPQT